MPLWIVKRPETWLHLLSDIGHEQSPQSRNLHRDPEGDFSGTRKKPHPSIHGVTGLLFVEPEASFHSNTNSLTKVLETVQSTQDPDGILHLFEGLVIDLSTRDSTVDPAAAT